MEGQLGADAPQWVVAWREGEWQCELHALRHAWLFHLYCGDELRDVWPCTGEPAFTRAEELRRRVAQP